MNAKRRIAAAALLLTLVGAYVVLFPMGYMARFRGFTVEQRLEQYGPPARARWAAPFAEAQLAYPPGKLTLLALKHERRLEVWCAPAADGRERLVKSYRVHGASGQLGPKLREGDRQVPEGVYPLESLNPNSRFHLSLRVGYPNAFDREMARRDGRSNLGGDIMIHGGSSSVGCLAMGDEAAEDLFVLAADTGLANVRIVIAPADLRAGNAPPLPADLPNWYGELHQQIRAAMPAAE